MSALRALLDRSRARVLVMGVLNRTPDSFFDRGATFTACPAGAFSPAGIGAFFFSLTVVPVLASYLIKRGAHHEPWLVKKLAAAYDRVLTSALSHSRTYMIGASIALVAAAGAFLLLGKSFMPTMDEGDLIMQLEKLPSIGLDQTIAIDSRVQKAILEKVPEVKAIVARAGADAAARERARARVLRLCVLLDLGHDLL